MTIAEKINEVFEAEGRPLKATQMYVLLMRMFPEDYPSRKVVDVVLSRLVRDRKIDTISHEACRYFYYKRLWKIKSPDFGFIYDELAQNYIKKVDRPVQ